jgi:hypothetical protein
MAGCIYGLSGITHIPLCAYSPRDGIDNLASFEAIQIQMRYKSCLTDR